MKGAVYVNGTRAIEGKELRPGDRVAIGEVVLRVGGDAPAPRLGRKRLALLVALGCVALVAVAILAGPAASAEANPVLHLEPNAEGVRWEGESGEIELRLALADPARALVELQIHAPERRGPLALRVNGADLSLDHGYPARIIVPALPGVHNTKWVGAIEFEAR